MDNEMELTLDLQLEIEENKRAKQAVKKAQKKKEQAKYEPTWDEVWNTGWTSHTGARKQGILQSKVTDTDRQRLLEVKEAIEKGELGRHVETMQKFTKAHALRLYQELKESRRESIMQKMRESLPKNYFLVQKGEQLAELCELLKQEEVIALDTETTGLDVYTDVIVGLSISLQKADKHYYIPVAHDEGEQMTRDYVLNRLRKYLTDPNLGKVLHNAKFDIHMFIRHGVRLRGVIHDTRIGMRILNENEPSYSLKPLSTKYGRFFGFQDESLTFEELFGKDFKFNTLRADDLVATYYASKDTHLTLKLYEWQMEHLRKRPELLELYRSIENPIIDVSVDMEQAGFLIDQEFAKVYAVELRNELKQTELKLKEIFGDINFNSPAQLKPALEVHTGEELDSTDKNTLKELAEEFPDVAELLKFRDLTKLLGTYIEKLPEIVKVDGRLHGQFNQVATQTGRFASSEPNLQNLPPKARKLIVAPKGKVIIGIDFSQIEPRVLSHISKDLKLREPYLTGQDLYSTLASRTFKVPIVECGDGSKYRKMMKTGLLACMYGTSMKTLAIQLGISVDEAQRFIDDFYEAYPDVKRWIREIHLQVMNEEFVTSMFGRKRRFPNHRNDALIYEAKAKEICQRLGVDEVPHEFWDKKYKSLLPYDLKKAFQKVKGRVERVRRQAVNFMIQGTSAEIMKLAMLAVHRYCNPRGWELIGTIHDEILFLVDDTITLQEVEELESLMMNCVKLEIPLKVDTELMHRWGEGVKKSEWFVK